MSEYIEINEDAWASIKQRDPDETIYMINLLKFRVTVVEGLGVDGRKGRDVEESAAFAAALTADDCVWAPRSKE